MCLWIQIPRNIAAFQDFVGLASLKKNGKADLGVHSSQPSHGWCKPQVGRAWRPSWLLWFYYWDLLGASGLMMFRNLAPNIFWDVLEFFSWLHHLDNSASWRLRWGNMYDSILFTDLDLLRATAGWRAGWPQGSAFGLLIFKSPPALFGWDV